MKIVVRRTGALGDVLCITPVLREMRARYPSAQIEAVTGCPEALMGCSALGGFAHNASDADIHVDLNLAYEKRPQMHVVDAYLEEAFGPETAAVDRTLELKPSEPWLNSEAVIIHAAHSWPSRTLPNGFWDEVACGLLGLKLKPVFVGGRRDYGGPFTATDARGQLRLAQVAALIAGAKLFIGSDSSLVHIAGTTETPIVGLYTSVRAKYRMPYRHGYLGWNMVALEAEISCRGCLEQVPAPATSLTCVWGTNACVRAIRSEEVLRSVQQLINPR